MPLDVQSFFQGFNFDTLLAIISCITGIVALFIGGSAYNQCKINKKSFNDKKEFVNHSQDHSQKAGRDIINNCDTTALASLTAASFETSLRLAYEQFEQKTTNNLHQIIKETHRIIEENSIQLGAYTKIDWINVYFENAKNTSDTYMQTIWAKVLAKELAYPGSFSYKTLDILRNLSADNFKLFEKLISLVVGNTIINNDDFKKRFSWLECLKMKELGLLNLDDSERTITVPPKKSSTMLLNNNTLAIFLHNDKECEKKIKHKVFVLTSSAEELCELIEPIDQKAYFVEISKTLKEKWKDQVNVTLHKVNWIVGADINYDKEDLIAN